MSHEDGHRLKRWRLIFGDSQPPSNGNFPQPNPELQLSESEQGIDDVLTAVYESDRKGGLGSSAPNVNRWLSDIRRYFPLSVVKVVQKDAFDRLNLQKMLLEPEFLETVEPDINLVSTLLTLKNVIPEKTKETARKVVRKVVEEIERKIYLATVAAVRGALNQASKTSRPRPQEIDWNLTIRANLKNYLPEKKSIIPERLIGHKNRRFSMKEIILCVDQSGSMATSVVYSSIFAAVLASIRSLRTTFVVFDTEVVDLSEHLADPVDVLFGTQLGGGTDIARAIAYCQQQIQKPEDTILVMVTDLFEGGDRAKLLRRLRTIVESGVLVVCLLALTDKGASGYCEQTAQELANLGIVSFACTPDQFPDLMATAIKRQDLQVWAAQHEIMLRATSQTTDDIRFEQDSAEIIL